MSIQPHRTGNLGSDCQNSYKISPVLPTRFKDWNDGLAVAHKPENRCDDILIERPTMAMGNELLIDYDEEIHEPPAGSVSISGKNLYERFRSHNRDTWWQYREDSAISKSADQEFKTYLLLAFAFEVGLNSLQRQRALKRFMQLDLKRGTGRTESNGFVICSLVANEDAERYDSEKLYHPQRSPENNDVAFQRLEDALVDRFPRITRSSLTKVYNKLRQGDPPTHHSSKWKGVVKRTSDIPRHPSYALRYYDPRTDTE